MLGHDHLIAMRLAGVKPVQTFVDADDTGSRDDWCNRTISDTAHVWIEPTDNLARLDLRCFIGLHVLVASTNEARVMEVAGALMQAGAKRVIASVMRKEGAGEYQRRKCVRIEDTEGEWTWQESFATI